MFSWFFHIGWVRVNASNGIINKGLNRMKNKLSIPEQHQLKIAKRTWYELSEMGALILGGMTKDQAYQIIYKLTGKYPIKDNK